jgi:rubrerythrin
MENETLWECRRCGTEYEGDTPDHDEQRYCRPDTPHDWQRMENETPTPETPNWQREHAIDALPYVAPTAPAPVAQEPDVRPESLYDPYSESEALSYMRSELREAATTIARLTAENERLTKERDAYKALVRDKDTLIWTAISQRDEARAEVTALRARVAELEDSSEPRWVEHPLIDEIIMLCDECGTISPMPCDKHQSLFNAERLRAQEGR